MLMLLSAIGLKTCIIRVVNSNFLPSKHSHLCPDVGASQPPVLLNSEEVDQEKIYLLEYDKQSLKKNTTGGPQELIRLWRFVNMGLSPIAMMTRRTLTTSSIQLNMLKRIETRLFLFLMILDELLRPIEFSSCFFQNLNHKTQDAVFKGSDCIDSSLILML